MKLKDLIIESIEDRQVSLQTIDNTLSNAASFDDFLKSFVGKRLKDLLNLSSFSNLYVMNKYGFSEHDKQDLKVLLNTLLMKAIQYVNFRRIAPLRKQLDNQDALDKKTPEFETYYKKRIALLKAKMTARQEGNTELEAKLQKEYNDLKDPSSYRDNFKIMDELVQQWHNTPLTLVDVIPSSHDTPEDVAAYNNAKQAFEAYKSVTSQ